MYVKVTHTHRYDSGTYQFDTMCGVCHFTIERLHHCINYYYSFEYDIINTNAAVITLEKNKNNLDKFKSAEIVNNVVTHSFEIIKEIVNSSKLSLLFANEMAK